MESVDHPEHYGGADNPYEAIKVIEAHELGFHRGNALKYLLRAGVKSRNPIEDLEKAIWYLRREITLVEGQSDGDTVDESEKVKVRNSGVTPRPNPRRKKGSK